MAVVRNTLRMLLGKKTSRYPALAIVIVAALAGLFYFTAVPSVAAQSAVHKLPELAAPAAGQRILVFSPHPDDETIGAGGYIAQSILKGADVRVVLVTNGDKDHNEAIRYSEFKKATGILGVPESNLVFLDFPDGKLASQNQTGLQTALRIQIDRYQPDIVIYPHPRDSNPDHAAVGRATAYVLASEPLTTTRYEYLVHYKLMYPRPYSSKFEPHLYLLPPTRLINVDKEWLKIPLSQQIEDLKQKALLSYSTQFHSPELYGLLHSSVRRNELLAVPKP
jgi:LmbE family N-acetylglucosaminyl deacetylase